MSIDNFSSFNINRWHMCKNIDPKLFFLVRIIKTKTISNFVNVCIDMNTIVVYVYATYVCVSSYQ